AGGTSAPARTARSGPWVPPWAGLGRRGPGHRLASPAATARTAAPQDPKVRSAPPRHRLASDGGAPAPRRPAARTTTSSHRGEIDREPADVAPVGIAHDQRAPRRPRDVPRGEAVDAAGEVPPVLLPCRGPLVLDEGRRH